ncbi:hypothetical protein J4G48_0044720 [Bradyrhizobium barranii subsp. apii]|uniref:hypothetical protein n=1 Tax=Bradyrhizobium barranii TaxID=2992140 RepID=UPI001AA10699|nr:hypothetical protein [Bradyrhizobium barranii]UPT96087.1 hypothetical protein J4G48_0044720 [Bradyrhizobium barranii subsp. apii]
MEGIKPVCGKRDSYVHSTGENEFIKINTFGRFETIAYKLPLAAVRRLAWTLPEPTKRLR